MKIIQIMNNNPYFKLVDSLGYVSINILQERMNISACPWFGMNMRTQTKPPLQLWNKEKKMSAVKSTHSEEVDKQIDRL
jgi:hypothetical protein